MGAVHTHASTPTRTDRRRRWWAALAMSAALVVGNGALVGHADAASSAVRAPRVGGAPQALPPRSVRHHNSQFWVWFAPRNWTSVDSKQGITITSGNGLMTIDDGFSSIFCASANTLEGSVRNYFRQQRAQLRASLGANWGNPTMDAGRITQLPSQLWGPQYFRQVVEISGNSGGRRFRGIVRYDYSLATGPQYCFARSTALTAPAQGFATSISQLRSVQATQAYFGPGLPPGPNGEPA